MKLFVKHPILKISVLLIWLVGVMAIGGNIDVKAEEGITECDRLAADPDDPDIPEGVKGVEYWKLNIAMAIKACEEAVTLYPKTKRLRYQLMRVKSTIKPLESTVSVFIQENCAFYAQYCILYVERFFEVAKLNIALELLATGMRRNHPPSIAYMAFLLASLDEEKKFEKQVQNFITALNVDKSRLAARALGSLYFLGYGVSKNIEKAIKWKLEAIRRGDLISMKEVGEYYVLLNDRKAVLRWLCRAKAKGVPDSQAALNVYSDALLITEEC